MRRMVETQWILRALTADYDVVVRERIALIDREVPYIIRYLGVFPSQKDVVEKIIPDVCFIATDDSGVSCNTNPADL